MNKNFQDMFDGASEEDWGKWGKEKQKKGGKRITRVSVEEFHNRVRVLELVQDIGNVRHLIQKTILKKEREFAELEAQLDYFSGYNNPEPIGSDAVGIVEEQAFLSQFEIEYSSSDQLSNNIPLLTDKKRKELAAVFGRDSILFRQKMGIKVTEEPPEYKPARKKLQAFLNIMSHYEQNIIRIRILVKLGPPPGLIVINKNEFLLSDIEEGLAEIDNIGINIGDIYSKVIHHEVLGTMHIQGYDGVIKGARAKYVIIESSSGTPIHTIVGNTYNAAMECLSLLEQRYSGCTNEEFLKAKKYLENIRLLGEDFYPN